MLQEREAQMAKVFEEGRFCSFAGFNRFAAAKS
jgi:hypothetical protein